MRARAKRNPACYCGHNEYGHRDEEGRGAEDCMKTLEDGSKCPCTMFWDARSTTPPPWMGKAS